MGLSALRSLVLAGLFVAPQLVAGLAAGDADTMFNNFNNAFLTTSGSSVFYKSSMENAEPDGTWAGSLDILAAEDDYERTGDPNTKNLINELLTTWLTNTPPPWSWDGWNDDIGWFTLALIRGYQITANADFLTQAIYGFNFAFGRGWDTTYDDGGIWEEMPADDSSAPDKEALSNDSLGKVACLIYQSTNDVTYLNECQQIYDWVWNHIFDPATGQVYTGINESGQVNTATAVYNQGTFLDYANLLWEITGNTNIYRDATNAANYGMNSLTQNGIFSNSASYLNTWADEMARGLGHFVRDNQLWDTYYSFMVQNANAILANVRPDYGITWNAWNEPTPEDNSLITNQFASAVAWLQYTPPSQPDARGGIHYIINQETSMAIDSTAVWGNGTAVEQWGQNGGINQRWLFTQNSDTSWNIVSMSTWLSLDNPGGSTVENTGMITWQASRNNNQRWWVDEQSDGSYKIWNQASSMALDGASSTTNGAPLIQWPWNGGSQQRWLLQT